MKGVAAERHVLANVSVVPVIEPTWTWLRRIWYAVIALPPFDAGAVQATVRAAVEVTAEKVGAEGAPGAVAASVVTDPVQGVRAQEKPSYINIYDEWHRIVKYEKLKTRGPSSL